MIDKQTAGILYSFGYKLKDSEGNVYDIDAVGIDGITLYNGEEHGTIQLSEIGTTYKIIASDLEQLTQEIEGKVPLIELAKIAGYNDTSYEIADSRISMIVKRIEGYREFSFSDESFSSAEYDENLIYMGQWRVKNQLSLFQYLYSLNFNIGFPEGSTTNLI